MCAMVIVERASLEKISLDGRINTLRRGLNSKRLYDRYRSECSRNQLEGWCNTVLNHLLRYSRKHDENEERDRTVPKQRVQNLETEVYNP